MKMSFNSPMYLSHALSYENERDEERGRTA